MIINKLRSAGRRFISLHQANHKPSLFILLELIAWIIINRGGINVYFDYELFLKGKKPTKYVSDSLFRNINRKLNSPDYFPILEDKYVFHQILDGKGFRMPRSLYLIASSGIYDMNNRKTISKDDFLLKDLDGFCKLANGFGGKNIFKLRINNRSLYLNGEEITASEFFKTVGKNIFLVQERIVQHKKMDMLNPSCVNTLRLLTIREKNNCIFYQGYLRVGIDNSIVDNSVKGNYTIGFDSNTGRLMQYAFSGKTHSDLKSLDRHPQTQTVFKDFELPFFNESIEMVRSLHLHFQRFFMIGWDIGITPEGPIVIEGNNITTLYPYQTLYGGLKSSFIDLAQEYRMAV